MPQNPMEFRNENGIYKEAGFVLGNSYLSEAEYGHAIAALILVTSDVVIIDRDAQEFFLARRKVKPMQGWWYIGGRRTPGETASEGAARNFERETGLAIPVHRFTLARTSEHIWRERKEEPTDVAKHDLAFVFALELDEAERARIRLDPAEYEGAIEPFDRDRLAHDGIHPSIVDLYDLTFPSRRA